MLDDEVRAEFAMLRKTLDARSFARTLKTTAVSEMAHLRCSVVLRRLVHLVDLVAEDQELLDRQKIQLPRADPEIVREQR
jgi:hypothetical protein